MLIQIILILLILFLAVLYLKNSGTTQTRAWKKIFFLLFIFASIVSVLRPDFLTDLAHLVGVGRGSDLLLYLLVIAFIFITINLYLKFKEIDEKMAKIVRQIVLNESKVRTTQDNESANKALKG